MNCVICQSEIKAYVPAVHDFQVSDGRNVCICDACADKLMKWQGERMAQLFPTKAMKRMHGGRGRN